MMRDRTAWALCAVAGLAVIAIGFVFASIGRAACDGPGGLNPVIRFEWVLSPSEVEAMFGADPCRTRLVAAMDRVNRIDMLGYIPAFTLLQLFAAYALRGVGRRLALLAAALAIVAAGCDLAEDRILLAITADLPGTQAMIDPLFWLVRTKFALLAVAGAVLGVLLIRTGGIGRWLGTLAIVGGAIGLAGLARPDLLAGIGLAWQAILVIASCNWLRLNCNRLQHECG